MKETPINDRTISLYMLCYFLTLSYKTYFQFYYYLRRFLIIYSSVLCRNNNLFNIKRFVSIKFPNKNSGKNTLALVNAENKINIYLLKQFFSFVLV